jgi:hypothetical protein
VTNFYPYQNPPVTFDYAAWVVEFPEFSEVSSAQAQGYFNRATLLCANDWCNPALQILPQLLNLLTAHVAWLNAPRDQLGNPAAAGQQAPAVVGRISTASEGSVSVGTEWSSGAGAGPTEAYYIQTKYGAEYWAASAPFRTFRYSALPTRVPSAIYPAGFGGFGFFGPFGR